MAKLTVQVRTRDDLASLLADGESPAWIIGQGKENWITDVQIVNFDGTQMIEAIFDRRGSWRRGDGRLVIRFSDARIVGCSVHFATRNPVRYVENS